MRMSYAPQLRIQTDRKEPTAATHISAIIMISKSPRKRRVPHCDERGHVRCGFVLGAASKLVPRCGVGVGFDVRSVGRYVTQEIEVPQQ